ncbi:Gfo/Idh/MocA family oxidoreductase, partial [Escherichia coli]
MSDNIRVGLIGYGYASKTFHAPLIAGTPGLELAVISSSDETKVKADWPTVTVVSEPKHLFNDPNIDTVMACKFFPGPVSRIAGMPDTAPSGAVFFIPSAIF